MGNSSRSGEHVYSVAQHEVLNEINKDEVLDDVVNFLRRAIELDRRSARSRIARLKVTRRFPSDLANSGDEQCGRRSGSGLSSAI